MKLFELESLRGIAALVVLFHHFLLEFMPHLHGRNFPDDPIALTRTPLFAFINGSAAVAVFFVLSGFVLTFRALEIGDRRKLLIGALKRWPRLVLLIVIVNSISALFLALGLYTHLGYAWTDPAGYKSVANIFWQAFGEGVWRTFRYGSNYFNSSLWTMNIELLGSFLAYAVALFMLVTTSFSRAAIIGVSLICLTVLFGGKDALYFAMLPAGVLMARFYIERRTERADQSQSIIVTTVLVCLAIVLCGYDGYSTPSGFYKFVAPYASDETREMIHGAGASLVLYLALFSKPIKRALHMRLARLLGRLSFPLYLVHLPVLHGIIFHLRAAIPDQIATPISLVIFIGLSIVVSYPLAILDEWWVAKLGSIMRQRLGLLHSNRQTIDRHALVVERGEVRGE